MGKDQLYETHRDRLFVRCIAGGHDNFKDTVHYPVCDFSLVLCCTILDDGKHEISSTFQKKDFENAGISGKDEIERVLSRMSQDDPPRLYNSPEMAGDPSFEQGVFMGTDRPRIPEACWPMLTTVRKKHGAVAFFYPGVAERISELMGGNYLVVFTSTHEVRIHPDDPALVTDLCYRLLRTNELYNDPEDILSKCIYRYSSKLKKLALIAEYKGSD